MADKSESLTQAGMARLNHSIEAFIYCTLSSQVNVRSSILGSSGSEKEAQREFLVLVENAIRKLDIWKSVQKFQRAIDEAKVLLILQSQQAFGSCPQIFFLRLRVWLGIITA